MKTLTTDLLQATVNYNSDMIVEDDETDMIVEDDDTDMIVEDDDTDMIVEDDDMIVKHVKDDKT